VKIKIWEVGDKFNNNRLVLILIIIYISNGLKQAAHGFETFDSWDGFEVEIVDMWVLKYLSLTFYFWFEK
jgi:hypothetical protein